MGSYGSSIKRLLAYASLRATGCVESGAYGYRMRLDNWQKWSRLARDPVVIEMKLN